MVEAFAGRGGTSANVHARGTFCSLKDVFRMSVIDGVEISANTFKTQLGKVVIVIDNSVH